jgi:hypothetical protein
MFLKKLVFIIHIIFFFFLLFGLTQKAAEALSVSSFTAPTLTYSFFFLLFGLTQGSSKKVKIVVRFCPCARAGSHDNQATALL